MIEKLTTICYHVSTKEKEILLIRKTPFSYVCMLTAGVTLIACLKNALLISILGFSIIFLLMNLRLVVYYMLYKQYHLQKYTCIAYGSVLSFRNPQTKRYKK